jgi:hypothetical protein
MSFETAMPTGETKITKKEVLVYNPDSLLISFYRVGYIE